MAALGGELPLRGQAPGKVIFEMVRAAPDPAAPSPRAGHSPQTWARSPAMIGRLHQSTDSE